MGKKDKAAPPPAVIPVSQINVVDGPQGIQINVFFGKGGRPSEMIRMLAHDAIEDAFYTDDNDEGDDGGGEPVVPSTAAKKIDGQVVH